MLNERNVAVYKVIQFFFLPHPVLKPITICWSLYRYRTCQTFAHMCICTGRFRSNGACFTVFILGRKVNLNLC